MSTGACPYHPENTLPFLYLLPVTQLSCDLVMVLQALAGKVFLAKDGIVLVLVEAKKSMWRQV
jgi:hypothetical protein